MTTDLTLPAFALDCRDWLVVSEADGVLLEEIDGGPVLAMLSTAVVVDDELCSASAILSLGLLEDDFGDADLEPPVPGRVGAPDVHVIEMDWTAGHARFILPWPDGGLAVIADFSSGATPAPDLVERFRDLVMSFRWAT